MLPILFQSNSFTLYSYPLFMGLGWGVAYQIYLDLASKSLSAKKSQFIFWGIFLFAWLGSKILFYMTLPAHLSANVLSTLSFWTGGGFVFYGGLIGALIFLGITRLFNFKISKDDLWPMLPALCFGHGIGRIGCFLAGCCFGSETNWWWGIHLHGADRHPTQILEAVSLIVLGMFLLKSKLKKAQLIMVYLVSYGALRFGVEILRGDEIRGQWGAFTPSQWISLGLVLAGLILTLKHKKSIA